MKNDYFGHNKNPIAMKIYSGNKKYYENMSKEALEKELRKISTYSPTEFNEMKIRVIREFLAKKK